MLIDFYALSAEIAGGSMCLAPGGIPALHTLLSLYECVGAIICNGCAQTTMLFYVGRVLLSLRPIMASNATLAFVLESRENFHLHKSPAALVYYTVPKVAQVTTKRRDIRV